MLAEPTDMFVCCFEISKQKILNGNSLWRISRLTNRLKGKENKLLLHLPNVTTLGAQDTVKTDRSSESSTKLNVTFSIAFSFASVSVKMQRQISELILLTRAS